MLQHSSSRSTSRYNFAEFNVIAWGGWSRAGRISTPAMELICTLEVGPRVLLLELAGRGNVFKVYADQLGLTGGEKWRIYGGHRLWHAPEWQPRSYAPDNEPVEYHWDGATLTLTAPVEPSNQVRKVMEITVIDDARLLVRHRLINEGPWEIELAPWALSVMAEGGRAVVPQEPYRPHPEALLPARPLVLWPYTNMGDERIRWGKKTIEVRQDSNAREATKVGMRNSVGWGAYVLDQTIFVKRVRLIDGAAYPDFGCNFEIFTNREMLELETLGPLTRLASGGGAVEHVEEWSLFPSVPGGVGAELEGLFELIGGLPPVGDR